MSASPPRRSANGCAARPSRVANAWWRWRMPPRWALRGSPRARVRAPSLPAGGAGRRTRPDCGGGAGSRPVRFIVLPKQVETAAAGTGSSPPLARPETEYIAFRHDWVRAALGIEPQNLILETAVGESMQPTIQSGDLLLVDTSDRTCSSFGVYVLEIRGERLVKRVQRKLDGSLVLISDNAAYQPDQIGRRDAAGRDGDRPRGLGWRADLAPCSLVLRNCTAARCWADAVRRCANGGLWNPYAPERLPRPVLPRTSSCPAPVPSRPAPADARLVAIAQPPAPPAQVRIRQISLSG